MENRKASIPPAIIEWYKVNGRKNLPWRTTKNPYKILIAELMLQKTHAVQQVLPVYTVFINRFPNINTLFSASIEEIKEIIKSLGLQNTRARRFKELAEVLHQEYKDTIPNLHNDLLNLPGVGEYVANAVECMAFNQPVEMVDANIGRVLGRVFYAKEEYPPSKKGTWKLAEEMMPEKDFKEFNLGIIDLGALVCNPKSPKCAVCTLNKLCDFYQKQKSISL